MLDVPVKWLTGEQSRLRFAVSPSALDPQGEIGRSLFDVFPPKDQAPLVQIVLDRFMRRCHKAILRDFRKAYGNGAKDEYASWGVDLLSVLWQVEVASIWQTSLMAIQPSETKKRELQEATVALVQAWELILKPWFAGKAPLQWRRVLATAKAQTNLFPYDELQKKVADLSTRLKGGRRTKKDRR